LRPRLPRERFANEVAKEHEAVHHSESSERLSAEVMTKFDAPCFCRFWHVLSLRLGIAWLCRQQKPRRFRVTRWRKLNR